MVLAVAPLRWSRLSERKLDLVRPLVSAGRRFFGRGSSTALAYPKALIGVVGQLPLVCGDKLSVRRHGNGKVGAHRREVREVPCSDRNGKLCAGRVGDVLITIIFIESAPVFRREDLRNDHARAFELASTDRAGHVSHFVLDQGRGRNCTCRSE